MINAHQKKKERECVVRPLAYCAHGMRSHVKPDFRRMVCDTLALLLNDAVVHFRKLQGGSL